MGQKNDLASWSVFLLLFGVYTSITYYVFNSVYHVQATPFIDEVFHIPQAKKYCNGTFNEVSVPFQILFCMLTLIIYPLICGVIA